MSNSRRSDLWDQDEGQNRSTRTVKVEQPKPPEPTWWEQWQANDQLSADTETLRDADDREDYDALVDLVVKETGKPRSYYMLGNGVPRANNPYGQAASLPKDGWLYDTDAIWGDIAQVRKKKPGFLSQYGKDEDDYNERRKAARTKKRRASQDIAARGDSWTAPLIGGITGSVRDPANFWGLFVGGGGKTVGQVVAREAMIGAGIGVLQLPGSRATAEYYGEDFTAWDATQQVGMEALAGGVGGGVLYGVGKGAAWTADKITPTDVKMARALESAPVVGPTAVERAGNAGPAQMRTRDNMPITPIMQMSDTDLAAALRGEYGNDLPPPVQGAVVLTERTAEIEAGNPFVPEASMIHSDNLATELEALLTGVRPVDYDAAAREALPSAGGPPRRAAEGYASTSGASSSSLLTPTDLVPNARVSSEYGPRKAPVKGASTNHPGIDLAAPIGTPIKVSGDGVVVFSGNAGAAGNMVIVDHGNGVFTRYMHMSEFGVKAGDKVSKGGQIGKVGDTGRVSGPHLHYEVILDGKFDGGGNRKAGTKVNPETFNGRAGGGQSKPAPQSSGNANTDFKRMIAGAESQGNYTVRNKQNGKYVAFGKYQYLKNTWIGEYREMFGVSKAEATAAFNKGRWQEPELTERMMDHSTAKYSGWLQKDGLAVTPINMYIMHALGPYLGRAVLKANPNEPIANVLARATSRPNYKGPSAQKIIAQNGAYYSGGKTVAQSLDYMNSKLGGPKMGSANRSDTSSAPAWEDTDMTGIAMLNESAADLRKQAMMMERMPMMESATFAPSEIGVDAGLMQFKAGGDEFGVTERLQGVTQWNPILAGRAIVWEAADGRRLIADGHQRLGLAKRIAEADPAQNVRIDAFVMREADGWDAETARVIAALKNVAEGSGSVVDAAKVMRGMGVEDAMAFLPPRGALVRDAAGVARLGDDAFGAVVNELVDPSHAAIVGRTVSDPMEQQALIDLLIDLKPQTLSQADSYIRQGMAAGFHREMQEDMFGTLDRSTSLFKERARVLERANNELRKLKQVFSTAGRNADTLETKGNRIDRDASNSEAIDNERAIEILNRLAFSPGAISDRLNAAARDLAEGTKIADVVKGFVADVRKLDIDALIRNGGDAGDGAALATRSGGDAGDGGGLDGGGRQGDAIEAGGGVQPIHGYSSSPDPIDGAWPSRAEIEAAGQTGFDMFDEPAMRAFDDPAGEGPRMVADDLEHDARAMMARAADEPTLFATPESVDPALAGRQAQAAQVQADSPMRAPTDQEDTIGMALFDAVQQGKLRDLANGEELANVTFDVDGGPRTLNQILDEIDDERAMIDRIKKCL